MATKEELKEKFSTGKKPTGEDFSELIEHQGLPGRDGAKGDVGEQGPAGEKANQVQQVKQVLLVKMVQPVLKANRERTQNLNSLRKK